MPQCDKYIVQYFVVRSIVTKYIEFTGASFKIDGLEPNTNHKVFLFCVIGDNQSNSAYNYHSTKVP